MLGFYNYTVILTYIGTAFGMLGIVSAINNNILLAFLFLMLCGVCDMFDGKIARTKNRTKQERRFGIQIDSISDFLCFGVLPAIIGYVIGMDQYYLLPIIIIYILAALIRLSYFNVIEEERQEETKVDRKICTGLPVPPAAIIFPIVYTLNLSFPEQFAYIYAGVMLLVSIAFVSKFEIKKLQTKELLIMIVVGAFVISLLAVLG